MKKSFYAVLVAALVMFPPAGGKSGPEPLGSILDVQRWTLDVDPLYPFDVPTQGAQRGAPKSLTVKDLRIVDAEGKLRAYLGPLTNGNFGLNLYDSPGRLRAAIGIIEDADQPIVQLFDDQGTVRISLGPTTTGTWHVAVLDSTGQFRAILYVLPSGEGQLALE